MLVRETEAHEKKTKLETSQTYSISNINILVLVMVHDKNANTSIEEELKGGASTLYNH